MAIILITTVCGGLGSIVAGLIVTELSTGLIQHFDILGYILTCTVLTTAGIMYFINSQVSKATQNPT